MKDWNGRAVLLALTVAACQGQLGSAGTNGHDRSESDAKQTDDVSVVDADAGHSKTTSTKRGGDAGQEPADVTTSVDEPQTPSQDENGRYVCDDATHGAPSQIRRLTSTEYAHVLADVLGLDPAANYPGSYGESTTGYSTEAGLSVVGEQGVEQLLYAAETVAEQLPTRLPALLDCSQGRQCAEAFLNQYGRLLFRRSLTSTEHDALLAVFDEESADDASFEDATSVMTAQLLQMPAFLYIFEQPSDSGEDRRLSGVELASRLSFHFWNSAPDQTLLDLAEAGKLDTDEAIAEQAARLFADARTDRGIRRFYREWTQTPELHIEDKELSHFDYLDEALVTSINESFDRFVSGQTRDGGSLESLLVSTTAHADASLAKFLELPAVDDWSEVALSPDRYAGLMTQPAMLAALAHTVESSFVFRGRFVRKRLLCNTIGVPPGNALSTAAELSKPENPTGKETSAVVTAQSTCGSCHVLIDPPGLAFEHFDGLGHYREQYSSGKAIDTTGTLLGVGDANITFEGPSDMMQALAGLDEVRECFARQVFRYSVGRLENSADNCAIQQIEDALVASDGQLSSAILGVTTTDSFKFRRGD